MSNKDTGTERPLVQIRMSNQQLSKLDTLRERSGRTRTAEVISLIEAAASEPAEVAALISPLAAISGAVTGFLGDWRQDAFAHETLRIAVNAFLDRHRPSGDPVCRPFGESGADLIFSEGDSPEVAARIVLGLALRPGG